MPRSPADPPGSVTVVGAAGETLNPLDFGHDPGTDEVPALDGYQDLGVIGRGGMAEVRRVRDVSLNRVMAMKIMHPQFIGSADTVARFLEEAQATAQLTHPGIIPVHSRGRLPDGRLYFTMKEVQGRTLREVIDALHESSDHTGWGQTDWGLTFRGLIATFSRVCEAVAYAHARGVIHRDIKPSNVMTGPFGEVHVLDWGLARVSAASPAWTSVTTVRSGSDAQRTAVGAIAGTPLFMPPEQAAGAFSELGPEADTYSLGAMLYYCLCGAAPYEGTATEVLQQLADGPPVPVTTRVPGSPPVPDELQMICARAMSRDQAKRYVNAGELADQVIDWLDGAQRRARALVVVERAKKRLPGVRHLVDEAEGLEQRARDLLADVHVASGERDKLEGWRMQDRAGGLRRQALMQRLEHEGLLHAALTHMPELIEGHEGLCRLYREDHRRAEIARDEDARLVAESKLRRHVRHLPTGHHERQSHLDYLVGDGVIGLITDPPGATVQLSRYSSQGRRLVARPVGELGRTPLHDVALPMGRYLLTLSHPDREPARYPVYLARQQRWSGTRPGDELEYPVRLLTKDEFRDGECYVPAGWFAAGEAGETRPVWVDGFIVQAQPVSNAEYVEFLDDLVCTGREPLALELAPRERGAHALQAGELVYGRRPDGGFRLKADADGDTWRMDWPVFMIDWFGATAFAAWRAARDGVPWRLMGELEWEKAARGVDGRTYPWGEIMDPSWCCMRHSHTERPLPASLDTYPVDVSPYGVRHMAGNVRDWLGEGFSSAGPAVVNRRAVVPSARDVPSTTTCSERGGNWVGDAAFSRIARRYGLAPTSRDASLGFRIARSVEG